MADSFTSVLNLCKPEIDQSAQTWGQKLNADLDLLDQFAGTTNNAIGSVAAQIAAAITQALPGGVIMAWAGNYNAVPSGWLLCDGTNGTPNLTDRFILGNTGTRANWETGGQFQVSPETDFQGDHNHYGYVSDTAITVAQMPYHRHGGNTDAQGNHTHTYSAFIGGGGGSIGAGVTPAQQASPETGVAGNHAHNVVTDFQGGNGAHNHVIYTQGAHQHNVTVSTTPPYLSLCYIMRA
jgi:hypothetical protein